MARSVGWRVHGWTWPVVAWARRKPRSNIRQNIWTLTDTIDWYIRIRPRIRRILRKN